MESISLAPEYWGACTWKAMFSVAYTYPPIPTDNERSAANNYFNALKYLLPCSDCREHYTELLKSLPVENSTVSKVELLKWLEEISNRVNKFLEKEQIKFQKIYEDMSSVKTVKIVDIPKISEVVVKKPLTPITRGHRNKPVTPINRGQPRSTVTTRKSGCGCGKNRKK